MSLYSVASIPTGIGEEHPGRKQSLTMRTKSILEDCCDQIWFTPLRGFLLGGARRACWGSKRERKSKWAVTGELAVNPRPIRGKQLRERRGGRGKAGSKQRETKRGSANGMYWWIASPSALSERSPVFRQRQGTTDQIISPTRWRFIDVYYRLAGFV